MRAHQLRLYGADAAAFRNTEELCPHVHMHVHEHVEYRVMDIRPLGRCQRFVAEWLDTNVLTLQ